jgi:hypothetical protein
MGDFEYDIISYFLWWMPSRCCGTRRMIFIQTGSKQKKGMVKSLYLSSRNFEALEKKAFAEY